MHLPRGVSIAGGAVATVVAAAAIGWGALALAFCAPGPAMLRGGLALGFVLASIALLVLVRPRRLGLVTSAGLFAAILAWWLLIPPRNDRDWQRDLAALAWADVAGDAITVHNVRNIEYRSETDFDVRYEDRTVRLSDLHSLDLFLSYWGSPAIAHTILSFGFTDGRYLAISIEARKEKGEGYSAIRGFFKQYELIFVVADERDLIRLRTNFRGENVYLYRLRTEPAAVRTLFLRYLAEINRLRDHPEWYNALTHNCTTAIRGLASPMTTRAWGGWKLYLNGYMDGLAYEIGAVDRSLPFPELRARSSIDERARAAGGALDFSRRIRQGLPGIPGA
jgi:Domain of unknown function (DUF4105)